MDSFEWNAPEYIHTEKSADWYWIVSIVAISVALISIILNNLIFGLLIIISAFTLSLYASRKPDIVRMRVDGLGVHSGKTTHPYNTLESFWIETKERYPKIILKSHKHFSTYITVLLDGADHEPIHHILSQHLTEQEHIEPFLEKLLIYLGF